MPTSVVHIFKFIYYFNVLCMLKFNQERSSYDWNNFQN